MDFSFFEQADIAAIEQLVVTQVEESHSLEFKRKNSISDAELSREDRKLLGEALSGFANAMGGTLLLGVATEKYQGQDRAASLVLIENADTVAVRYRSYANECVSPPIEGLRVRSITDNDGRGVIAIGIPQGQARPHMSTAPGHHTYYRRVMDTFVPMQHYEVEEMMRLKGTPSLSFIWGLRSAGSIGKNRNFSLLFGLRNDSRVTAKFPYISYLKGDNQPSVAEYGLDGNGNTLWPKIRNGSSTPVIFAAGGDSVIHPGQSFFVSKLDFCEVYNPQFRRDWGISNLADGEILTLCFEFGCEDHPAKREEISFTKEQLLEAE